MGNATVVLVGVTVTKSLKRSSGKVFMMSKSPLLISESRYGLAHHLVLAVIVVRIDLVMIFFQTAGLEGLLEK